MKRTSRIPFCILLCLLFSSCNRTTPFPTAEISPTKLTTFPPTVDSAISATDQSKMPSASAGDLLKEAVTALEEADSFRIESHEIRDYRILNSDGTLKKDVFGEFITTYLVVREPELKIHRHSEYRFNPQDQYYQSDLYLYEEGGKYFSLQIEGSISGEVVEIDPQLLEPFTGDVYQTLVSYASQAIFTGEVSSALVFRLYHPKWYRLKSAIGFADLGILLLQPNSEQVIEQYVAEHYPNVESIRFTIFVSTEDGTVKQIIVDDRDFMTSVWAEVDRALIAAGEKPENLTRYEVKSDNGAIYIFDKFNQVDGFEIPVN